MVKAKRRLGTILTSVALAFALAIGLFGIFGDRTTVFADDEPETPADPVFAVRAAGATAYKPIAEGAKLVFGIAGGTDVIAPEAADGYETVYLEIRVNSYVTGEKILNIILKKEGDTTLYYLDDGTHNIAEDATAVTWADEIEKLFYEEDNDTHECIGAQSGKYTMTFSAPSVSGTQVEWFELEPINLAEKQGETALYKAAPDNAVITVGEVPSVKIMKKDATGNGWTEVPEATFEYETDRSDLHPSSQVSITIVGTGNYKGKLSANIQINRAPNLLAVSIDPWDYGYFEAGKNGISVSATEGSESVEYSVTDASGDVLEGVLAQFKLVNGEYPGDVAKAFETLDAGSYRLQAAIAETDVTDHDAANYLHALDNTYGYPFTVRKAVLASPSLNIVAGVNDTYTGSELVMQLGGFNDKLMALEFDEVIGINGVLYATEADTYTITIKLKDPVNSEWSDGSEEVTLNWTIAPMVITRPTDDRTDFTVNGKEQTYNPIGFDSRYMLIEGNVRDDEGTTVVTVELKDKKNLVWDNGTVEASRSAGT